MFYVTESVPATAKTLSFIKDMVSQKAVQTISQVKVCNNVAAMRETRKSQMQSDQSQHIGLTLKVSLSTLECLLKDYCKAVLTNIYSLRHNTEKRLNHVLVICRCIYSNITSLTVIQHFSESMLNGLVVCHLSIFEVHVKTRPEFPESTASDREAVGAETE